MNNKCLECGMLFSKLPKHKRVRKGRKFCSNACHYKAEKGQNHGYVGSNTPMWKGGRKVEAQGYVMIYQPHHPRAQKQNPTEYVKEHILVVEKALGRFLKEGETCHHINEIRDDNRLENLYLFPSGGEHTAYHHGIRRGDIEEIKISNLINGAH